MEASSCHVGKFKKKKNISIFLYIRYPFMMFVDKCVGWDGNAHNM